MRNRIGIAVGPESLTGVVRGADGVHTVTVPMSLSGNGDEAAVGAAMLRLRAELDAAAGGTLEGAAAHIALLPPLSDARVVQLPPLRPAEAIAVLRRDAGRYFVGIAAPRVVGVRLARGNARGTAGSLAAAAAESLVSALRDAAAAARWRVIAVAPAVGAWTAAASERSAPAVAVAVCGDTAHLMAIAGGAVTGLRRVPAADADDVVRAAAELKGVGSVAVFADAGVRQRLVRAFTDGGWTPTGLDASAADAAARYAHAAGVDFVSTGFAAERRAQETGIAVRLAMAALVLIVASGAVELWGARRELTAIRGRRAEIRATVEPLLALRDSAERLSARVGDIDSIARGVPRWTGALFDLAMLLPPESHVTRLYASGDTLTIDAEGARAGTALEALRGASTLRDVKLLGTVDRQLTDGATTAERFRISARLAREGAR